MKKTKKQHDWSKCWILSTLYNSTHTSKDTLKYFIKFLEKQGFKKEASLVRAHLKIRTANLDTLMSLQHQFEKLIKWRRKGKITIPGDKYDL